MQDTVKNGKIIKTQRFRNIHGLGVATLALLGLATAPAVMAQTYTLTTLASFNGTNGHDPDAGLTLSGSTLYGTTIAGGENGRGEIYSLPITGGTPTVLTSFTTDDIYGSGTYSRLILSGSTLYGTAVGGGANGFGTVYSFPVTGGTRTVLGTFSFTNGAQPFASLTLSGSTFYGTTEYGGYFDDGVIYSLPVTGGDPKVLTTFNGTNGSNPIGDMILSGNTLYGTTCNGGSYGDGTVFSVPITGGDPTILANFNGTNGSNPFSGLVLSDGILYGSTEYGAESSPYSGKGGGTIFSLPITGGTPTILATFNGAKGSNPQGNLILSGNTLYGTTYTGANSTGTVFKVSTTGGDLTAIATIPASTAGLVLSDGTFYSTTNEGGSHGEGTLFSLTPDTIGAPVPEASSVVSLGLLLALGLGGMVIATKRSSTHGNGQH